MTEGLTKKELVEKAMILNEELVSLEKAEKNYSQAAHTALAGKLKCKLEMIKVKNNQAQVKIFIDECHEIQAMAAPIRRDG